ncbi:MAG: hypothetical protein KatS3mg081_0714 [Gemmatimonadales bacterium]|nr:Thiamine-monophosphate kinase [bacterium HR33]GIW51359.1 MAG: hypothetical protein KatS3mg081_0714 [Gemmatimonadales bacterium]
MSPHIDLGPGAEFDRIRAIWRRLGERASDLGDDAHVLELDGRRLAVSTDASVEGTHFRVGWLQPFEIGWRAAVASLSDLAAVAADPRGVLVSVGVPRDWPEEHLSDLMEGVGEAAAEVGAKVWGGDLVRAELLMIDVVSVGVCEGEPVLRRGAQPGDGLWVTGKLGGCFVAVAAWNAGREPDWWARERFARPRPRVQEARWLRDRGAKALIDISDGLVGDAGHLAAASGVGIVIDVDHVPVHPSVEVSDIALVSGEEYELLVALPAEFDASAALEFSERFSLTLTRIGHVDGESGVRLVREGKRIWSPKGFEHF